MGTLILLFVLGWITGKFITIQAIKSIKAFFLSENENTDD